MPKDLRQIELEIPKLDNDNQEEGVTIEEAVEFAKNKIHKNEVEYLIIIFIKNNKAVSYSITTEHDNNTTGAIPFEKIIRRAVYDNVDSIIMMHNHPTNEALFSSGDLNSFKSLYRMLVGANIKLEDDIIVTPTNGSLSFKEIGLISAYESLYTIFFGFEAVYFKYLEESNIEQPYSLSTKLKRINSIIKQYGNSKDFQVIFDAM